MIRDEFTAEQLDAAVSATFHDMIEDPVFLERCELSGEYKTAVSSFLAGAMQQWGKLGESATRHPYEYLFACVSTVLSQGIAIGLTLAEQRELERLTQ